MQDVNQVVRLMAAGLAALTLAACAARQGPAPAVKVPASAVRYACADGVSVAVQPQVSAVPEVANRPAPIDVYFAGTRALLHPMPALNASGVRYASARVGWEWFGSDDSVLRDTSAGKLLARGCRPVKGTAASPAPER